VTKEEVRGMAGKIKDSLEKLGIKCEDKPQHSNRMNRPLPMHLIHEEYASKYIGTLLGIVSVIICSAFSRP